MPSPMDENDNRMNIDTPSLNDHKRKLDGSAEESLFPCKKVLVSAPTDVGSSEATNISVPQVKLTKAEREMLKLKKSEERERERLKREQERQRREEEKLQREEERQKKQAERDESRRKKDAEKEEARRQREEKERAKEEARRKKEEEIERKQKSQTRLNSFFSIPKKKPDSPQSNPVESISDYHRYFQPFHVRQDVVVAPEHQFVRDHVVIQAASALIDSVLPHPIQDLPSNVCQRLDTLIPACISYRQYPRGRHHQRTAREAIALINENPTSDPYHLLKQIPRKHLQYHEDVRPAYSGTFTRKTKLTPRNPFKKDPEAFAYDYDSEAEWEFEPEDGENLDDESLADDEDVESSMGDSGDEEDKAFLDDEDDEATANAAQKQKGKRFVAALVPVIKGLCWETSGVQRDEVLAGMRATMLLYDEKGQGIVGPINPFSSDYWANEMPPPPAPKIDAQMSLKNCETSGTLELVKRSTKSNSFPAAQLRDFLKAIQGSTDNQILLVELLKKKFPTIKKGSITEKVKEVAFRTGRKDTDHWEIRKEFLSAME